MARKLQSPKSAIRVRSPAELLALLVNAPRYLRRADLTPFERLLLSHDPPIVPKALLLKHNHPLHIDTAIADLLDQQKIALVTEIFEPPIDSSDQNTVRGEFIHLVIEPPAKPMRRGRYVQAQHPDDYRPKGTRPVVQVPMLRKDRNLVWYLGNGRMGDGIQSLCHLFREFHYRMLKSYPPLADLPKDVL